VNGTSASLLLHHPAAERTPNASSFANSAEFIQHRIAFAIAEDAKLAHARVRVERRNCLFVLLALVTVLALVNQHVPNVSAAKNAKGERIGKPPQILKATFKRRR
jgi:hypothetical protein